MDKQTRQSHPLYFRWTAFVTHEWLRSGIANADELAAPFHLALLYLFELHSNLQRLLHTSGDSAARERVLNRVAILETGPVTAAIPDLLASYGGDLARRHRRPVKCFGDWFSSYSHAVASHRDRTSQLFDATLLWHPESEVMDFHDFIQGRQEAFNRFREGQAAKPLPACFDFVVEHNNGCFSGRDLAAYEVWLAQHPAWDLRGTAVDAPLPLGVAPVSSKALQGLLDISDATLLEYRKKAGLPIGSPGKKVQWPLNDIVVLCDAIVRCCPTPETCERASQLKARCLPNGQFS